MSSADLKPESKPEKPKEEVRRGRLHVFMKEGGCEESYTACVACDKQKDNCREAFSMLNKCMNARPDYFQPYFALMKNTQELMVREIEAFLHAKPEDRDELYTKFMIRGPCKEAFMAWRYFCIEAKKNNRSCLQTPTSNTMFKCMESHSNYHHPLLTVFKNGEEYVKKEIKATVFKTGEEHFKKDMREQAEADAKG